MSVLAAFKDGWRRVLRAPTLIASLWLTTVLVALPLTFTLHRMITGHLGASLAAGAAVSGVNFDWWNEFLSQAAGVGQTFVPAILGFAAVMKNLSSIADATPVPPAIAWAVAANIGASVFLLGGVLDRLARDRRTGSSGFFAACGVYFFRYLRLAVCAGVFYAALFWWLHPWLFEELYTSWTRNVTAERLAFVYRLVFYLAFVAVLLAGNLIFDYAKIRLVVEDRRSALGALISAVRFVWRQPRATMALYLLNGAVFLLVLAFYFLAAPGASGGAAALVGLLVSQLYIVLRVLVRLTFAASQIALFQGRLAHAGYTARPLPTWPDSAAAEAIRPRD